MHLSRRDLAKSLPALAGACFFNAIGKAETARRPDVRFPTAIRERLSVTSWPFRTYIESPTNRGRKNSVPGMDLKDFAAFVLKNFDVRNINPISDHFSSTGSAYLESFRAAVAKAGSHVVDLGIAGRDFFDPDASARDAAVAFGSKWIDIAVQIGSPSIRQHLRVRSGQKPDAASGAESLGRLAEYGAKRNIVVNLENDDAIAEDPFLIVATIEKVNSPYLRALPDFGNALVAHDQSYSERGVAAMLKHAYNMCHVKDEVQSDDGRSKKVNLKEMFSLARQSSYKGYYSMEFDTDFGDPITGTKRLVAETLQYSV